MIVKSTWFDFVQNFLLALIPPPEFCSHFHQSAMQLVLICQNDKGRTCESGSLYSEEHFGCVNKYKEEVFFFLTTLAARVKGCLCTADPLGAPMKVRLYLGMLIESVSARFQPRFWNSPISDLFTRVELKTSTSIIVSKILFWNFISWVKAEFLLLFQKYIKKQSK